MPVAYFNNHMTLRWAPAQCTRKLSYVCWDLNRTASHTSSRVVGPPTVVTVRIRIACTNILSFRSF